MIDQDIFCVRAMEAGFAEIGFCSIHDFELEKALVAQQAELNERKQLRFEPKLLYPQAQSLAVLLWPYIPAAEAKENQLFIDSYYRASNAAYHAAIRLEESLIQAGIFAKANVSFPAKAAAVRAGLGVIGKNSLLITPKYGTRVVIILMATGIPYTQEDSFCSHPAGCLNCGRCAAACPVHALDAFGMSHPERCLRNYMMEGIVVPENARSKIGMRLLGCDLCQRACPLQPKQNAAAEEHFQISDFITTDSVVFSKSAALLAQQIGRNAARPQRIRAQAALVAGNTRSPVHLPVLYQWAQSEFETVSIHAKWAIQQIEQRNA